MKSLRAQLSLGLAVGLAVVFIASGALLDALIRRSVLAEFDDALASKARSLAALVENNEDGIEFELTESSLPASAPGDALEYYQIWRPDGSVLARSTSLAGHDLDRAAGNRDACAFRDATLPDGRPGRVAELAFQPRRDPDLGPPDHPVQVDLVVGRSTVGVLGTLAKIRAVLIGVCSFAVLLSIAIAALIVRRSLRPVDDLGRQISQVGADGLATRIVGTQTPTELAPIVARLNDLLARLETAFERERRFTGDVAHELRTPLAGLRSKLELALSRHRTTEAYQAALRDCLAIDLQMQRMVETLLGLARADAGLREVRREVVNAADLVRACWKPLQERALARRLEVEWRLDGAGNICTDRERLSVVIHNILDNAVTYANDGGRVTISLGSANGIFEHAVRNTGNRVGPDQVARVFDRFWRGDSHYPMSNGHFGLGLPLCKAVIEELGGTIQAAADGGEFTVAIRLPAAA
jgi:two-component system heavy metal sensor histidine kinase CusS